MDMNDPQVRLLLAEVAKDAVAAHESARRISSGPSLSGNSTVSLAAAFAVFAAVIGSIFWFANLNSRVDTNTLTMKSLSENMITKSEMIGFQTNIQSSVDRIVIQMDKMDDFMAAPRFTQEDFAREGRIIHQEIQRLNDASASLEDRVKLTEDNYQRLRLEMAGVKTK